MSVIGSNALAGASGQGSGGYEIERSLRFNSGDSAYLNRTLNATGSGTTGTYSFWIKRSELLDSGRIVNVGNYLVGSGYPVFYIQWNGSNDSLIAYCNFNGLKLNLETNAKFRDPSAWYHVVVKIDTTQATNTDRAAIYVNGVEQTYAATTWPSQNDNVLINLDTHPSYIGCRESLSQYLNAYLADIHFIDGQALTPSDFGEYDDNNVWQPKKYSGSYGTNGFHLDFSDTSSASALGTDSSGNGNNFTPTNLIGAQITLPQWWTTNSLYTTKADVIANGTNRGQNGFTLSSDAYVYLIPNNGGTSAATVHATGSSYPSTFYVFGRSHGDSTWTYKGGYSASEAATFTWNHTDSSTSSSNYKYSSETDIFLIGDSRDGSPPYQPVSGSKLSGTFPALTNTSGGVVSRHADVLRDSPTNGDPANDTGAGGEVSGNYATWNPINHSSSVVTTSDGNLVANTLENGNGWTVSTLPLTSGKYYCEITFEGEMYHTSNFNYIGIVPVNTVANYTGLDIFRGLGALAVESTSSNVRASIGTDGGATQSVWNASIGYDETSTVGIAIDCDTPQVKFYVNGVDVGTYPYAMRANESWVVFANDWASGYPDFEKYILNAGQRTFNYAAPSGYKAMCTANLPDPTIADGSTAFDIVTYTSDGSSRTISGLNMSPDLVWSKRTSASGRHVITDSVRGVNKEVFPDRTSPERTSTDGLTAFNSDGYTLGADAGQYGWQANGATFVNWAWDAGSTVETLTAGAKNSQTVNQSQKWSTYGTFTGDTNTSYPWSLVFNEQSHYSANGCLYVPGAADAVWEPTSGISCTTGISFYVNASNPTVVINKGLSDETSFTSGSTGQHQFTVPFSGSIQKINVPPAVYLGRINIDGKLLADNDITFNVPSSASTFAKNDSAGFSITKFNSSTTPNAYDLVYHGLSKTPEFIITKSLATQDWYVYHKDIGLSVALKLNDYATLTSTNYFSPQAEIYEMGQLQSVVSGDYISYNWTSVDGYSAFGKYTGNNNANGPVVCTGFRPAFILTKGINDAEDWYLRDTTRSPFNPSDEPLRPNDAGYNYSGRDIDILSNGFKIRTVDTQINEAGKTYLYAAFAEHPFKTARAR